MFVAFFLGIEAVEIDSVPVVDAEVVADGHVLIGPFHDPAEPLVVVAVVVLDVCVHGVVVGVEGASVMVSGADVAVDFVVLNPDSLCVEIENAVARVVAAAGFDGVVFVDGVVAGPGDDGVASRVGDEVAGHMDAGPGGPFVVGFVEINIRVG